MSEADWKTSYASERNVEVKYHPALRGNQRYTSIVSYRILLMERKVEEAKRSGI